MRKVIKKILLILFLGVFLFSGWQIYQICSEYAAAEDQYAALEQYAPPAQLPTGSPAAEPSDAPLPEVAEIPAPEVDFPGLAAINPDVVGWLYIEDTRINYPVVRTDNNDYYLTHQFDGTRNGAGCLFLNTVNGPDFSDPNQIIYGHYMKNKSMFHDLSGYREQSFYDSHPEGWLVTPTARYRIRFFSAYVSDTAAHAWDTAFTEEEQALWLEDLQEKSCFSAPVSPTAGDRVLTLSTCSYEFHNARFVVHGVLEEVLPN